MRILIITQYFWPENFRINEVSEELVKLGHKVYILTGYPNYPKGEIYSEFKNNSKKFSEYKGSRNNKSSNIIKKEKQYKLSSELY